MTSPVADLGFSGGVNGLGDKGEGAYPPPAGGPGAWPRGNFFANRRRKYAFSRPCLGSICLFHQFIFGTKMSINLLFSSKCIHEVDNIFRMTTFVKYTGTAGCALTISGGSRNFVWGPVISFLDLPSFPYPPFPSLSSV
jgi:hypothetical protein